MEVKSNSTRLIVNTGAQYVRTIINVILSLYSTRLILLALGVEDYGIFTLVGGVVTMLSFMTNAMVTTTQRFMSFHQTRSDLSMQQKIFGNSVIMHLIFSAIVLILLEIAGLFIFDGFLNIPPDRISAAQIVYQCAITMILLSFITAPFKALLISHENLVYISVIDVLDGLLKVMIALILCFLNYDKLVLYGMLMILIYLVNLLALLIYDFRQYKECVLPKIKNFDKDYLKSMGNFVWWQLYSTGCVVGRTQGTAIILNRFYGATINAAFGIALQISGMVNFISSALVTSINPQIVKAEGNRNRAKMFELAEAASKFSFLLLVMIVIPVSYALPDLLEIWLGSVPKGSVLFCRVILYTALIDQLTYGLGSANQAIGNIGAYAFTINTIKVLTLPCLWFLLLMGLRLYIAIWCYAFFELICALCRIPFLKYSGDLRIWQFTKNVFFKLPLPCLFLVLCYSILKSLNVNLLVFIIAIVPVTLLYAIVVFRFALNTMEKSRIQSIIKNFKVRIIR